MHEPENHQWPGTFHGSQAILSADVSQRQMAELTAALRRALAKEERRPLPGA